VPSACAPRDNGAKRSSEPARSHRRSNSPLSLLACRRWRVGAPAQPQSVAHSHERGSLLQCRTAWVCEGSRAAPNPNVACMLPPVRSLFLRRACTVPTAHGIGAGDRKRWWRGGQPLELVLLSVPRVTFYARGLAESTRPSARGSGSTPVGFAAAPATLSRTPPRGPLGLFGAPEHRGTA
jgi:hypothetical protein